MRFERYTELITNVAFSSPSFLSASDDTLSGDVDIDFPGAEDAFFSSSDVSEDMLRLRSTMRGGSRLSLFIHFFVGSVFAFIDAVVAR